MKLVEGFVLDLPDAFACKPDSFADLFERHRLDPLDTISHAQYLGLAVGDGIEQIAQPNLLLPVEDYVFRAGDGVVFDDLVERVHQVEADRLSAREVSSHDAAYDADPLGCHVEMKCDLLDRRLAPERCGELCSGDLPLGEHIDHVRRDADRLYGIGDRSAYGLLDPPGGVSAEPAFVGSESLDRLEQAYVAFFDEIEEWQAAIDVRFRNADYQPQVGGYQPIPGLLIALEEPLGEILFRFRRQQFDLADVLEICFEGPFFDDGSSSSTRTRMPGQRSQDLPPRIQYRTLCAEIKFKRAKPRRLRPTKGCSPACAGA